MDDNGHVGIDFGGQPSLLTEMWEHLCAPHLFEHRAKVVSVT